MQSGSPPAVVRRAKPLLGTLVEIRVEAGTEEGAQAAVTAAFAEIATVHQLMSFHEANSDLSRLNRASPGTRVRVDARTAVVLACAEALRLESGGAFDCGVAEMLIATGGLPPVPAGTSGHEEQGAVETDDDVVVVRGEKVLDLGGIAKGYAVDRGIEVLQRHGVRSALVNAGGDLRHFGPAAVRVLLRNAADPSIVAGSIELRDAAIASSVAGGLSMPDANGTRCPTLFDGRPSRRRSVDGGASVVAPSCMLADALTKVVLVGGKRCHAALRARAAEVVMHRRGNQWPARGSSQPAP